MSEATKTCKTCGIPKPLDAFSKHPNTRDRRNISCRKCDSARLAVRRAKNSSSHVEPPNEKLCPICGVLKLQGEFGRNRSQSDGLSYACKPCTRERSKQWRAVNPEAIKKNRDRLATLYRDDPRRYLDYRYRSRYGISLDDYERMLTAQDGVCAICRQPPTGPRLAVDHDHSCCPAKSRSCGKCVRGLLCGICNRGLGYFRDDPDLIAAALTYLTDD